MQSACRVRADMHADWIPHQVRIHCPATKIKMAEVTALAFLSSPPAMAPATGAAATATKLPPASPSRTAPSTAPDEPQGSSSGANLHLSEQYSLASRRRLLLVADATSTLILFDVSASGRPPHPLQRFSHPRPRATWLSSSRTASLSRQHDAQKVKVLRDTVERTVIAPLIAPLIASIIRRCGAYGARAVENLMVPLMAPLIENLMVPLMAPLIENLMVPLMAPLIAPLMAPLMAPLIASILRCVTASSPRTLRSRILSANTSCARSSTLGALTAAPNGQQ